MILKDIVNLLANRINQPHVIECYLRKVYAEGYKTGTKQSPWIRVKDALPNENANGMCEVKYVDGDFGEMAMRKVKYWIYPYIEHGYVTHWRPIVKQIEEL